MTLDIWLDIWYSTVLWSACIDTILLRAAVQPNNVPVINVKLLWHNLHCKKRYINKGDLTWLELDLNGTNEYAAQESASIHYKHTPHVRGVDKGLLKWRDAFV